MPLIGLFLYGLYHLYRHHLRYFCIGVVTGLATVLLASATSISWLRFLYDYVPFYSSMREPHKWVMVLVIMYTALFAYTLNHISKRYETNLFSYIFILLLLIVQFRFLFGFWGQVRPVEFPLGWQAAEEYISTDNPGCSRKILMLPWHMYLSYPFTKKIVANLGGHYFSCPVISGTNMEWGGIYDNNYNSESARVGRWLQLKSQLTVPPENIGYIVLVKTVDWELYRVIDNNQNLEKVLENDDLLVYKVTPNSSRE